MITDDIELLNDIFNTLYHALLESSHEIKGLTLSHLRYEELGMTESSLHITDVNGSDVSIYIPDKADGVSYMLDSLYKQMSERGEQWKSLVLTFTGGKVNTKFSYEDNPAPW